MSQDKLRDLCAEAVSIEGTGAATFLGAMRGHRSFAEAFAGVLPLAGVNIKIEEANAQGYIVRWEHSTCTVTETGFTRVTCINSSNGGEFEEFSTGGYKRAFVFIPVADLGSGSGITPGTKAEFNTALTDGDFAFSGDAPTAHTHALSNLTQSGATTSQVATWSGTAWVPATPSSGGMSIGGAVTGGTVGRVPYVAAGPVLAQDADFNYNSATHTLTVGLVSIGQAGNSGSIAGIAKRGGYLLIDPDSADLLMCYDNPSKRVMISGISGPGKLNVFTANTALVGISIKAETGQVADLLQALSPAGAVMSSIKADGSMQPASLADAAATNNSTYLSTDSGKLSYKDAGGTVHALHA